MSTPISPTRRRLATLAAALLVPSLILPAHAGLGEREISFSEEEVQTALARKGKQEKNYGGILLVSLRDAPTVRLGLSPGRIGLAGRVFVTLVGNPTLPVDVTGSAGLRYDDASKAFYLDNPLAESVETAALPREAQGMARQVVSQFIAAYFRNRPVYQLREDGTLEEQTARWLLKSVRVEPGRLIATLSPF